MFTPSIEPLMPCPEVQDTRCHVFVVFQRHRKLRKPRTTKETKKYKLAGTCPSQRKLRKLRKEIKETKKILKESSDTYSYIYIYIYLVIDCLNRFSVAMPMLFICLLRYWFPIGRKVPMSLNCPFRVPPSS